MAEDHRKIPEKVSNKSNPPVLKQLAEQLQQEKLRLKQIRDIRRSYVVHGRAA